MIERCGACGGRQRAYSVKTRGASRVRYLRCVDCPQRSKSIVPIDAEGKELPKMLPRSNHIIECPCCRHIFMTDSFSHPQT
jgi:hypothetical protein